MDLENFVEYPFERKKRLFEGIVHDDPIDCSLGEPRHVPPRFILEAHNEAVWRRANQYPGVRQIPELSAAIATYARSTHGVALDDPQILALCGSGEGLYSAPFLAAGTRPGRRVIIPNPAYKVYEGATLVAGLDPWFVDLEPSLDFAPDLGSIPSEVLRDTCLLYLNSPSNPCATVATRETLEQAIELSRRHGFILAADECYIDIWFDRRPASLLAVARDLGVDDYSGLLVYNSLSKRSSLPGLRSGFMAGDARLVAQYFRLRIVERKVLPVHIQEASAVAWRDAEHAEENRLLYLRKAEEFAAIVGTEHFRRPEATFFVWLRVPGGDDETFARRLWKDAGVSTVPGRYLATDTSRGNPGAGFVRVALVHDVDRSAEAARRIRDFLKTAWTGAP